MSRAGSTVMNKTATRSASGPISPVLSPSSACQRAFVWAVGVAEEHKHPAATVIGVGNLVALLVREVERSANRDACRNRDRSSRGVVGEPVHRQGETSGLPSRARPPRSARVLPSGLCEVF